eukprot:2361910-Pleurochrysis_carterae.AAC.3
MRVNLRLCVLLDSSCDSTCDTPSSEHLQPFRLRHFRLSGCNTSQSSCVWRRGGARRVHACARAGNPAPSSAACACACASHHEDHDEHDVEQRVKHGAEQPPHRQRRPQQRRQQRLRCVTRAYAQ